MPVEMVYKCICKAKFKSPTTLKDHLEFHASQLYPAIVNCMPNIENKEVVARATAQTMILNLIKKEVVFNE